MSHIDLKLNLKALPGAKYMNVAGFDQPCIVIPVDPTAYQITYEDQTDEEIRARVPKKVDEIRVPVMLWQQSYDAAHPNSPTHRAQFSFSEQKRKYREQEILAYLSRLTEEQYTAFTIATFQNKQGTAKLPQTREEAAHWYCSRKDRIGVAWEQRQQAPKAEGEAVAATPVIPEVPDNAPTFGTGDGLPF